MTNHDSEQVQTGAVLRIPHDGLSEYWDTLRDTIASDVPDTVWESDALSRGAGA